MDSLLELLNDDNVNGKSKGMNKCDETIEGGSKKVKSSKVVQSNKTCSYSASHNSSTICEFSGIHVTKRIIGSDRLKELILNDLSL